MNSLKLAVLVALACFAWQAIAAANEVDFRRDVKPIFEQHCVKCHDAKTQESGLRLDLGGGVLRGGDGGAIVVAGDAANSRLMRIVQGDDEDVGPMPPEGDPLSKTEIA
ncbi:MAG TPA: c-type cytochrome domain-containing protein, partial [Pirellulaceae bacterium]|nr:c-type cytochrome domain-containing protein [Pirellulaceae bacterium]